jgi:hypothetical protein
MSSTSFFFRLPPPPAVVVRDAVSEHRYVRPVVRPAEVVRPATHRLSGAFAW